MLNYIFNQNSVSNSFFVCLIFFLQTNETLLAMTRLKNLIKGVDTSIKQLRVEGEFKRKFMNIVKLVRSPFVQLIMANYDVDSKMLDAVFDGLLEDKQLLDIVETVGNIFECFSVDRFVGVNSEKELQQKALELNQKKLFHAGVYFGNDGYDKNKEFSYKIRMDIDNTPVTSENRNRFWFPGPNGNFELEMRYHRGFVQIQQMLDQAIIKTVVDAENMVREEEWKRTTTQAPITTTEFPSILLDGDDDDDSDFDDEELSSDKNVNLEVNATSTPNESESNTLALDGLKAAELLESTDSQNPTNEPPVTENSRRKRQASEVLSSIFGGGDDFDDEDEDESGFPGSINFGNMQTYTKQFPYPKYRRDGFMTAIYLAQVIQLTFFFALIVQITNAVRNRIWMRESGNSTV